MSYVKVLGFVSVMTNARRTANGADYKNLTQRKEGGSRMLIRFLYFLINVDCNHLVTRTENSAADAARVPAEIPRLPSPNGVCFFYREMLPD